MSNMSHCRFQNTLGDLRDCYDAMDNSEPGEMGFDERLARWHLIHLCIDIVNDFEHEAEEPKPQREGAKS